MSWRVARSLTACSFQYRRCLATQAQQGLWSSLSHVEQSAWKALNYDQDSWEGRKPPPPWKAWSELTSTEKSIAIHGLEISDSKSWNAIAPKGNNTPKSATVDFDIPSLASLMNEEEEKNERASAIQVAKETRAVRQHQAQGGTLTKFALSVGSALRSSSRYGSIGMIAGSLLEQIPTALDDSSVLDITGIDTVLYLDDSGSMNGSNLNEGYKALRSLEERLKAHDDNRFLPTRIVKFGDHPQVLAPSDEHWSSMLVSISWDASSGGTYMWKMIQDDVKSKYRPAGGKLRVVVITDGADNMSPGKYAGVRGFDPLMTNLLDNGYDIEWNIIVVGNYDGIIFKKELSESDQRLYESLCRATGGHFVSVGVDGWNENDKDISTFLEAIEDSGYEDTEVDRIGRQEQYRLEAGKGGVEKFDWLPAIPRKPKDE
jgi:hypothetical protein